MNSVPASADILWSSVGTRPNVGANYTWQTPIQVEGEDGANGQDASGFVVNLDGQTVEHEVSFGTARAGVRFNSDGTVDRREGASYSQIDSATDWITPRSGFGDFWFRATGSAVVGSATNVWIAHTSNPEWRVEEASSDSTQEGTILVEVAAGSDGNPLLDSSSYVLRAINLP